MGVVKHRLSTKEYHSKNKVKRWPVYHSWVNMRQRCNNQNNPDYNYYGGRGIKHCDRWHDFMNFLEDMGHPPTGYTLDRIDTNGDYSPTNCKWSSRLEQARNRNYCRKVTFRGETKTVADWADVVGMRPKNLYKRIYDRGWDVERAMTQPLKTRQKTN